MSIQRTFPVAALAACLLAGQPAAQGIHKAFGENVADGGDLTGRRRRSQPPVSAPA